MSMQAPQAPSAPDVPAPPAPTPVPVTQPAAVAPAVAGGQAAEIVLTEGANPTEVLVGLRESRTELRRVLERLEDQRDDIARELRGRSDGRSAPEGADRAGLEARLAGVDARIAETEARIAVTDAAVAQAAAVPGAVVPPPPPLPDPFPEEVFVLGGMIIVFGVFPMAVAYARRVWKRSAVAATTLPRELWERFAHLEQAVDTVAFEVERIGEGQRFITRVFNENTDARIAAVATPPTSGERDQVLRGR